MNTNGGPMILVLIVVALAAGCQKKPETGSRSPARPAGNHAVHLDPGPVVEQADQQSPPGAPETAGVTRQALDGPELATESKGPPEQSDDGLVRAKRDLTELGDGVSSLRSALLDARFVAPAGESKGGADDDRR